MALNTLFCADMPLRNYSLTGSLVVDGSRLWIVTKRCIVGLYFLLNNNSRKLSSRKSVILFQLPSMTRNLIWAPLLEPPAISKMNWERKLKFGMRCMLPVWELSPVSGMGEARHFKFATQTVRVQSDRPQFRESAGPPVLESTGPFTRYSTRTVNYLSQKKTRQWIFFKWTE